MDVLSEVLKVVKLQGAMFYHGEFSSPWSLCSPASRTVAPYLATGAGHVIIYHLLTEGHAFARLVDGERIALDAGDLVIFPHGDPHVIENGVSTKTVDMAKELARIVAHGLKLSRFGGGGEVTRFICGFMACDRQLSHVFLSGLPPVFKVSIRNDASGRWLENSIRFSVNDADASRAGGEAVLAKLSEVLFVETLRAYIAPLSTGRSNASSQLRPRVSAANRDRLIRWVRQENLDCREDRVDCFANHSLSACRRGLNPKGISVMAGGLGGRWPLGSCHRCARVVTVRESEAGHVSGATEQRGPDHHARAHEKRKGNHR